VDRHLTQFRIAYSRQDLGRATVLQGATPRRSWGGIPRNRFRFSAVQHAHWMWEWELWDNGKLKN